MTRTGSSPSPARTVFFGSGGFAVPILERLAAHAGAWTSSPWSRHRDRPKGRARALTPTPVAARAARAGDPAPATRADPRPGGRRPRSRRSEPDLGVLADYGRIVPRQILDLPAHGILNVHPSLLPRHRGATRSRRRSRPATRRRACRSSGWTTASTRVRWSPSDAWPLEGNERAPDLESDAARRGAELLALTLEPWRSGAIQAVPQDEADATTTRPFRREDGRLDPGRPAVELERQVRANAPWPGSFVETGDGRVGILAASAAPAADQPPGTLDRRWARDRGRGAAVRPGPASRRQADALVGVSARPADGRRHDGDRSLTGLR